MLNQQINRRPPHKVAWPTAVVAFALLGLLLLAASYVQIPFFKHDAYRSISLACILCALSSYYLTKRDELRVSRKYVILSSAISIWGVGASYWASAAEQALLFGLLPPIFFILATLSSESWRNYPEATCLSLAYLAIAILAFDTILSVVDSIQGVNPYRMVWPNEARPYIFYNSRDANQFHLLMMWSGLPCLWLAFNKTTSSFKSLSLAATGIAIPAMSLFLILNSQGDGALLATLIGYFTSLSMLRGPWRRILAVFALGLGIGAVAFVIFHAFTSGDLFGDVLTRNASEFSAYPGGRMHTWSKHLESIWRNGLWHGAGYRAIPTGSKQCDPHNLLIGIGYWLGIPGLLLLGSWITTLNWKLGNHPACVQALLPGTFGSLAVYQLVDAIWGFPPTFVLLCVIFGIVCPLVEASERGWKPAVVLSRKLALLGITLVTLFFVLAQQPGFNSYHPARRSCLMAFGTRLQFNLEQPLTPGSGTAKTKLR